VRSGKGLLCTEKEKSGLREARSKVKKKKDSYKESGGETPVPSCSNLEIRISSGLPQNRRKNHLAEMKGKLTNSGKKRDTGHANGGR